MKQKIIKVGNSAAVLIPKQTMKERGLQIGDEVAFQLQDAAVQSYQVQKPAVSPELKAWLEGFLKEYKPVLDKLARM